MPSTPAFVAVAAQRAEYTLHNYKGEPNHIKMKWHIVFFSVEEGIEVYGTCLKGF